LYCEKYPSSSFFRFRSDENRRELTFTAHAALSRRAPDCLKIQTRFAPALTAILANERGLTPMTMQRLFEQLEKQAAD
jgi:hypothetical protein